MPDTPLDKIEIQITSSSDTAVLFGILKALQVLKTQHLQGLFILGRAFIRALKNNVDRR